MEEIDDNLSSDGAYISKVKSKKRSLVERELETNLTDLVTSPSINDNSSSTSRYGRSRRSKSDYDVGSAEKSSKKSTNSPIPDKSRQSQSPAYKMHASNSPVKLTLNERKKEISSCDTPTSFDTDLNNKIEHIYHENISLSRFGSSEKKNHSSNQTPKVYVRKDLIQKREKEEETMVLIKNLFSPGSDSKSTNSHLKNVLDRSSEKYGLIDSSRSKQKKSSMSSVVKTLDFDNRQIKKSEETKEGLTKNEVFEIEAKCEYQVGDLAWARMGTYPYWPCIITRDPIDSMFVKKKLFGRVEREIIHVTFFGDNGRRSWICDGMLRKFLGQLEFEATREHFDPAAKKKDPKLYAAFFVSEKKKRQWSISVEEAETLLREPKRLRIDLLYNMLEKPKNSKQSSKKNKSSKITRTASDVSLSESLYDTLFSEDDGKVEDLDRSRNKSKQSLDVSEVVTACLDSMAAKTGITKIQRQSHMDRWLQKAKSKTPEKSHNKTQVPTTKETSENSTKKNLKKTSKNFPKKKTNRLKKSNETHVPGLGPDTDSNYSSNEAQKDVDYSNECGLSGSGIGHIAKVESLSSKEIDIFEIENMGGSDTVQQCESPTFTQDLDEENLSYNETIDSNAFDMEVTTESTDDSSQIQYPTVLNSTQYDNESNISDSSRLDFLHSSLERIDKHDGKKSETDIESSFTNDLSNHFDTLDENDSNLCVDRSDKISNENSITNSKNYNTDLIHSKTRISESSIDLNLTNISFNQSSRSSSSSLSVKNISKKSLKSKSKSMVKKRSFRLKMLEKKKIENDDSFLEYVESHRDLILDEHPELSQEEVVEYLRKTWLYERSDAFETKELNTDNDFNMCDVTVSKNSSIENLTKGHCDSHMSDKEELSKDNVTVKLSSKKVKEPPKEINDKISKTDDNIYLAKSINHMKLNENTEKVAKHISPKLSNNECDDKLTKKYSIDNIGKRKGSNKGDEEYVKVTSRGDEQISSELNNITLRESHLSDSQSHQEDIKAVASKSDDKNRKNQIVIQEESNTSNIAVQNLDSTDIRPQHESLQNKTGIHSEESTKVTNEVNGSLTIDTAKEPNDFDINDVSMSSVGVHEKAHEINPDDLHQCDMEVSSKDNNSKYTSLSTQAKADELSNDIVQDDYDLLSDEECALLLSSPEEEMIKLTDPSAQIDEMTLHTENRELCDITLQKDVKIGEGIIDMTDKDANIMILNTAFGRPKLVNAQLELTDDKVTKKLSEGASNANIRDPIISASNTSLNELVENFNVDLMETSDILEDSGSSKAFNCKSSDEISLSIKDPFESLNEINDQSDRISSINHEADVNNIDKEDNHVVKESKFSDTRQRDIRSQRNVKALEKKVCTVNLTDILLEKSSKQIYYTESISSIDSVDSVLSSNNSVDNLSDKDQIRRKSIRNKLRYIKKTDIRKNPRLLSDKTDFNVKSITDTVEGLDNKENKLQTSKEWEELSHSVETTDIEETEIDSAETMSQNSVQTFSSSEDISELPVQNFDENTNEPFSENGDYVKKNKNIDLNQQHLDIVNDNVQIKEQTDGTIQIVENFVKKNYVPVNKNFEVLKDNDDKNSKSFNLDDQNEIRINSGHEISKIMQEDDFLHDRVLDDKLCDDNIECNKANERKESGSNVTPKVNGFTSVEDLISECSDSEFNIDTSSINSEDSEQPLSAVRRKLHLKNRFSSKKAINDPEFSKYIEMRQDSLMEEHPELSQEELVEYMFKTWQYEENSKSELMKNDDIEQSGIVKGSKDNLRQKSFKNSFRKNRNRLPKRDEDDVISISSDISDISEGRKLRKRLTPVIDDHGSSVTKESSPDRKHDAGDDVSISSDTSDRVTRNKSEQFIPVEADTLSMEHIFNKEQLITIEQEKDSCNDKEEPEINELNNDTERQTTKNTKTKKYFDIFKKNDSQDKSFDDGNLRKDIIDEFDPDTASINSSESGVSGSNHKRKHGDKTLTKDDPDFIKYLELRQDALMDENPQLSQSEIESYLFNTWIYEENVKSDIKKSDEIEQATLVKGLSPSVPTKKTKRKSKIDKDIASDDELVLKDKPKRKTSHHYYNENVTDAEDEIEVFDVCKSPKQTTNNNANIQAETENDNVVIDDTDEVEYYFSQLTQTMPNLFKGLLREKVCEICEKTGNLLKCKGCNSMFHVDCVKKQEIKVEVSTPSRGRKKKRKAGRKPKNLDGSESHSDEKGHDVSYEINAPTEVMLEPETHTVDAESFEAILESKMKEMFPNLEANYDAYASDESINWSPAGQCEIVDVTIKPKSDPNDSTDFKCHSCEKHGQPVCFVCKEIVSKKGVEYKQRCQTPQCHKYYHLECLDHWPQTQFNAGALSKSNKKANERFEEFMCPRHVCHTCVSDDPRGCKTRFCGDKLARCVRCPATYHTFTKCVPAGTQILTGSQILCPRHYEPRPGKVPCHVNTGWCFICALGGTLVCCEYCPTSFHADCLKIVLPEGSYMCEDCETGRLPLYGEMVWVKLGHYRWWPGIILHPSEIPENILAIKHSVGEFVVRFFGQYDYNWVNRGRVFPFQEGDSGKISSQKSKIDAAFTTAIEHAQRACEIKKSAVSNKEEDTDIASSILPPHYVKLKVNKPYGSLCGRKVDVEESSLTQCECDPTDEEPCGPYSQCINRMLLTECGPSCRAGDRCNNRNFEKRNYPPVAPHREACRGWGLRALAPIRQGQFVIEYVGELIDEEEFRRRMKRKHEIRDENFYFLTLDKERMIDAGPKGNLARFMNHCCEPNCETQKWTVLGDVRVGLFALKDIPANSELTFNYNLECAGIEKKRCLCGAKRCSGYIGAKPKQDEASTKKPRVQTKRTYKKRKNAEESPQTKPKIKKPIGRPAKPKELTEIEQDLLIIKNATNGISSDSEGSRLSVDVERNTKALKRSRVSFENESVSSENGMSSAKRAKVDDVGD